jgi:hypothetical protein
MRGMFDAVSGRMQDAIAILVTIAFFLVALAYVFGCQKV